MSGRVIAVRPMDDQRESPGRRLRVQQDDPEDIVRIVDETTLPERVRRIDAHRVAKREEILLTVDEATWLHMVLGEMLLARAGDGEPLTGWPDVASYSKPALIAHLRDLRQARVSAAADLRPIVERAYELRIADAERELAIRNVRETLRTAAEQVPE